MKWSPAVRQLILAYFSGQYPDTPLAQAIRAQLQLSGPHTDTPQLQTTLQIYANSPCTITPQLVIGGMVIGEEDSFTLMTGDTLIFTNTSIPVTLDFNSQKDA